MAITICTDRVTFGSYNVLNTPGGMCIEGSIIAKNGFCDTQIPGAIGRSCGYAVGGKGSPGQHDTISKYSFTSDGNDSDVGDLPAANINMAGAASDTNGYSISGAPPLPTGDNNIYRFPFASDTNATTVGQMTQARRDSAGHSSPVAGYTSGGKSPSVSNKIDKFPFAADNTCFDVGDLEASRFSMGGHSSNENGYASGGCAPTPCSCISKFPFASDTNASTIGAIGGNNRGCHAGHASPTAGFMSGGRQPGPTEIAEIRCFPFASDNPATDVGSLCRCQFATMGSSSTECGYNAGRYTASPASTFFPCEQIHKFAFISSADSATVGTLVGSLSQGRGEGSASQN